ncbi:hypothetical protein [Nocardia flavorosea]|uniref:Uncharacterized protein n=1 Tax=Nocardia flavorosea TaxID=53429 RepID=A0A846Y7H8_9NOCA|nr:hypothetical protein [Nocardia flavorosea]NKY55526.1 hypothetical protein [Nocardia flavorosea]
MRSNDGERLPGSSLVGGVAASMWIAFAALACVTSVHLVAQIAAPEGVVAVDRTPAE